jgi:SAM-dependent methyltransferase
MGNVGDIRYVTVIAPGCYQVPGPRRRFGLSFDIQTLMDTRWHEAWGAIAPPAVADAVRRLNVPRGARVLDVGTGGGVALPSLAEAVGPDGCVVAIDTDAAALDVARRRVAAVAASARVAFRHGRIEELIHQCIDQRKLRKAQRVLAARARGRSRRRVGDSSLRWRVRREYRSLRHAGGCTQEERACTNRATHCGRVDTKVGDHDVTEAAKSASGLG